MKSNTDFMGPITMGPITKDQSSILTHYLTTLT